MQFAHAHSRLKLNSVHPHDALQGGNCFHYPSLVAHQMSPSEDSC
jgi:hypothetical protein